MQLAVGSLSQACSCKERLLLAGLTAPGSLPQATVEIVCLLEGLLTPILFYHAVRGATDRTVIVTVAVIDWCFGHQGEGKKLRKQEERNSGSVWGKRSGEKMERKEGQQERNQNTEENISEAKNSFLRHSHVQSRGLDRIDFGTEELQKLWGVHVHFAKEVCREDNREINRGKGGKTSRMRKKFFSIPKGSQTVAFRDKHLSPLKQEMYIHLVPSLGTFEKEKNQKLLSFNFFVDLKIFN